MKVVHVVWRDSESSNEWTPVGEIGEELELTHSAGLLVKETETFILLALSFDPETESINNHKKIPRVAIEKMRTLCSLKI